MHMLLYFLQGHTVLHPCKGLMPGPCKDATIIEEAATKRLSDNFQKREIPRQALFSLSEQVQVEQTVPVFF